MISQFIPHNESCLCLSQWLLISENRNYCAKSCRSSLQSKCRKVFYQALSCILNFYKETLVLYHLVLVIYSLNGHVLDWEDFFNILMEVTRAEAVNKFCDKHLLESKWHKNNCKLISQCRDIFLRRRLEQLWTYLQLTDDDPDRLRIWLMEMKINIILSCVELGS